jgi:hypothetical protein
VTCPSAFRQRLAKNRVTRIGPRIGFRAAARLPPPSDQATTSSVSIDASRPTSPVASVARNCCIRRSNSACGVGATRSRAGDDAGTCGRVPRAEFVEHEEERHRERLG